MAACIACERREVNSADTSLAIPINDFKGYLDIETEMPFAAFMTARRQSAAAASGITPPSVITKAEPNYSDQARKAGLSGTVSVSLVVDEDGYPKNPKVIRSLESGLDEKAIEAVQKWRFKPGTKDGRPVATQVVIDVNFRLLGKHPEKAPPQ